MQHENAITSPARQRQFVWHNNSSETCPPFGLIRIDEILDIDGDDVTIEGNIPDGETGCHAVNRGTPIGPGKYGRCTIDFPTYAAFSSEPGGSGSESASGERVIPENNQEWGPRENSWYLHRDGSGFRIFGNPVIIAGGDSSGDGGGTPSDGVVCVYTTGCLEAGPRIPSSSSGDNSGDESESQSQPPGSESEGSSQSQSASNSISVSASNSNSLSYTPTSGTPSSSESSSSSSSSSDVCPPGICPVTTGACPSNPLPCTLTGTVSANDTGNCIEAHGLQFPLVYDCSGSWAGVVDFYGRSLQIVITPITDHFIVSASFSDGCQAPLVTQPVFPLSCNPFHLVVPVGFESPSEAVACGCSGVDSVGVDVTL